MGFIKGSFNMEKCVAGFQQKKGICARQATTRNYEQTSVTELNPYVYTNLLLPILKDGSLTLSEVDFSRFEREDIESLSNILYSDRSCKLLAISVGICCLEPAAMHSNIFI